MFLAIIFIVLGVFLLLNAMGIIAGNFWGFFWAIVFLAVGAKMLIKNGKCPMCGWKCCIGKMHRKAHQGMSEGCCGGHEHNNEE